MRSIKLTLFTGVAGLAAIGVTVAGAGTADRCASVPIAGPLDGRAVASAGLAAAALDDDRVVTVDRGGERRAYDVDERGVLRHLTVARGLGVAFVDDVAGPDGVVLATAAGIERIPADGEATHPDLSPTGALVWVEDMRRVRLRTAAGGEPIDVAPPPDAAAVFSPAFAPDGSIVAVVEEAVEPVPVEGEMQSNLYRLDAVTGTWSPLTAFRGSAERWTAIRTPVVRDSGEILFVRVGADPDATRPAAHELWRVDAAGSSKVRDLAGRRFLAGTDGDEVLWNVDAGEEWLLVAEAPGGARDLGCGHVLVDPVARLDPDLEDGDVPPEPDEQPVAQEPANAHAGAEMAVVVGDFESRSEAAGMMSRLGIGGLRVIDHGTAPGAVAPGAYAVALPLPRDADVEAALDAFRARFPEYVERSWVTSLG